VSQCPTCQTSIEIKQNQFGSLFTCTSCQAVFFVDWSGQPEAPLAESTSPTEILSSPQFEVEAFPSFEAQDAEIQDQKFQDSNADNQGSSGDEPLSLKGAMSEVLEFANAPQEQLLRSYQIEISGLDLERDVQKLKDVLGDQKFKFDPDSFIDKITHGNLKISDLSPVKAAILVRKLEMEHFEICVTLQS
jgi:hypothetical protein